MLVHGVKGELLTRTRVLIPLAATRRECRHFFPLLPSSSIAQLASHALRCGPVSFLKNSVDRLHSRLFERAAKQRARRVPANVDRILSIEPLLGGAGMEAAYHAPDD